MVGDDSTTDAGYMDDDTARDGIVPAQAVGRRLDLHSDDYTAQSNGYVQVDGGHAADLVTLVPPPGRIGADRPEPAAIAGTAVPAADSTTPSRGTTGTTSRGTTSRGAARRRPSRPALDLGPWLITTVAFVLYTLLAVLRYERRQTMSWDLGIFTEAVKQYAHLHAPVVEIRGHGLNLLGDHFHPILIMIAPFFRLFPTPVTLLVAQSLLLAVAAVPITRTAMDLIGRRAGYAIGIGYALSWGIVSAANFDFHEIAFAVPLLAFSLTYYLRGVEHDAKTLIWALPLVLVKEDIALLAPIIVGMVVARRRYPGRLPQQAAGIAVGVAAGLALMSLLVRVVIPHYNPDGTYFYWADSGCVDPALHNGIGKLMTCVPDQLMNGVGEKWRTIAMTLIPVAFIALRSPLVLLAVPGIAARFLNVKDVYWGTDYHYAAVPMVIVFVAAIDGLVRLRKTREQALAEGRQDDPKTWLQQTGDMLLKHGAAMTLGIAVALTQSFPLQDLWRSDTWHPDDRAAALKRAEAVVPDGVTVETTLDMLAPLAARTDTEWMGNANNIGPAPQYIVFNLGRSDWGGQETPLAYAESRHPGVTYQQVYTDDGDNVYVFRESN